MKTRVVLNHYQSGFIRELHAGSVRFLVLGGMAMRAHGLDRATHDLDLFVDNKGESAERLVHIMAKGFRNHPSGLTLTWLSLPDKRIALPGGEAEHHEIDALTSCGALDFNASFESRMETLVDDFSLPVLGLRELIYSKIISADRNEHPEAIERDILDLAALLRIWEQKHSNTLKAS